MSEVIKSYKGFDKDLKCRDFQYEIGGEYETDSAKVCEKGFHACEVPLDVFRYYAPATNRYCEVEQSGQLSKDGKDSKVASSKIKIGAEIGIPGLVKAQIEWVKKICEKSHEQMAKEGHAAAQGDEGHASAQGDEGHAASQGWKGHAAAQGSYGHAAAQGDEGHAASQGWKGHAASQGWKGHAASQGWKGHAAAQGWKGHAAAQGSYCHAASQGSYGHAEVKGKNAIAAAFGVNGAAKACLGSWIMAAEWVLDEEYNWNIVCVLTAKVDGEEIKPDTWYSVKNGKFVEVK